MVNDMEMVNKNILMMIFMKVIGIMIKKKELVAIFLKMEKFIAKAESFSTTMPCFLQKANSLLAQSSDAINTLEL